MIARHQHIAGLRAADYTSYRQTCSYALRKRDDIRLDAILLKGEQGSAPADPHLHFIIYEEDISAFAEFCRLVNKFLIKSMYSALALHKFHQESAWIVLIGQLLQSFGIIDLRMHEARHERCKYLLSFREAGCSNRGKRPSVERFLKRDYRVLLMVCESIAVLSCRLYGSFVCLSSRICEPHLAQSASGHKLFGKQRTRFCIVQIRCMLYFFQLPYDSIQPCFILISQRICSISAAEVHILPAIRIGDHRPAGMIDDHIIAVICMDDILCVQFLDMAAVHHSLLSLL